MTHTKGEWLTVSELRAKLKLSRAQIYRVIKRPGFPRASNALGPPRYWEPEVDTYLLEHRDCLFELEECDSPPQLGIPGRDCLEPRIC